MTTASTAPGGDPHELKFAPDISDQVLMLDSGRVIESGPPDRICSSPEQERTREFLSAAL